jgi:bis(5'-nucleosyl)-tetraphosphatase (symmetrical)
LQRIFVGDVQGCGDELDEVLDRAGRRFGRRYELWTVGDLVNRGPHSLGVLRRVRELAEQGRARSVLGNHDLALVATALGARPLASTDTFTDVLGARDLDDWVEWLRRLPLAAVGRLGDQPFAMLHASVHPDWSLAELSRQAESVSRRLAGSRDDARGLLAPGGSDPLHDVLGRLTRCRSVSGDAWSPEPPRAGSVAWHAAWSRRGHDYGVVYGHWSLQGLHVAPKLRGLDTGCVHNGRSGHRSLTAWLPDPRSAAPFDVPDTSFWSIPARRVYYPAQPK